MQRLNRYRDFIDAHRDRFLDLLRIYLGAALVLKGLAFVRDGSALAENIQQAHLAWADFILAHYVVLAHVCGGLLLAAGMMTRLAALAQLPVLVGAVFFVHAPEGLFAPTMGLEVSILVLFLLVLFAVAGGGRWSVDYYLSRSDLRASAALARERARPV